MMSGEMVQLSPEASLTFSSFSLKCLSMYVVTIALDDRKQIEMLLPKVFFVFQIYGLRLFHNAFNVY